MAFIVIHKRDTQQLKRIADALERLCDIIAPPEPQDDSMEIVSIDRQKKRKPEDDDIPESARMP